MRRLTLLLICLASAPGALQAREVVDASAPESLAVTVYRDPGRGESERMDRGWPQGFAMISEVRTVTLPPGESTIRFTGVAEGMVAVSAIVTGLPGGTIEKNRDADLLSPAALVDGTLGNRVTITRTNPATGEALSENAIVRTRADGGLVLETQAGFEAVRCSGLPEKLTFDRVPAGLSPQPVFSLNTRSAAGGTYTVTLSYLAWGFDWEAHYVARLLGGERDGRLKLDLLSWLTILNDNGQSFPDAELMAVAGSLNIQSDFEELADPPLARPLRLTCYPLGSTAAGSPVFVPPPPPMAAMAEESYDDAANIVVTGNRIAARALSAPAAMVAQEEELGDLKLYRIPEPITVAAKGMKQVAFLDRDAVRGRFVYVDRCDIYDQADDLEPTRIVLATRNEKANGLGVALPQGGMTVFEPSEHGDLLVAETQLRDYAVMQDIELELAESTAVFAECGNIGGEPEDERDWTRMRASATNANDVPVTMRFVLGWASEWEVKGLGRTRIKDGERIFEVALPANSRRDFLWRIRSAGDD